MNHYINLLEEQERSPIQTTEAPRLLKPIAAVAGILLVGGIFLFARANSEVVREAEDLSRRWQGMEAQVKQAQVRSEEYERIRRSWETLMGWPDSRIRWQETLQFVRDSIPAPIDHFQFLNLSFDEEIRGLRDVRQEQSAVVHPLVRAADLRLIGRIQDERPDRLSFLLEDRLRGTDTRPSPFTIVKLENPPTLPDIQESSLPVRGFHYTLSLHPTEIQPTEIQAP